MLLSFGPASFLVGIVGDLGRGRYRPRWRVLGVPVPDRASSRVLALAAALEDGDRLLVRSHGN